MTDKANFDPQTGEMIVSNEVAEFRNYLLMEFSEYNVPLTMTAEQVQDLIIQFYNDYTTQ
jgi:hypothetical protein